MLASLKDHDDTCVEIIEVGACVCARDDLFIALKSISERLSEATPEELVAHTTVLVQMARFKPTAFEHRSDAIMAFLIKKLLMGRRSRDPVRMYLIFSRLSPDLMKEEMDVDDDWVQDGDIAPIQRARIFALKVCRNRCLANASAETAVELATPALKMFSTLLEHSGSFSADAPDRLGFSTGYGHEADASHLVRRSSHACDYKPPCRSYTSAPSKCLQT